MLIRFRVKNFLSYREEACLTLVPGRTQSQKSHVVRDEGSRSSIPILKGAFVFGANASGKSNLIKAMDSAQRFILGERRTGIQKPTYFRLDAIYASEPTEFIFEFRLNSVSYEFGFHMQTGKVAMEWLSEINKNSERKIYSRRVTKDGSIFENGKLKLKKEESQFLEFTQKGTTDSKLFLTECRDRNISKNIKSLTSISDSLEWFEEKLKVIFPSSTFGGLEFNLQKDMEFAEPILKILKMFDTGVDNLKLEKVNHEDGVLGLPDGIIEDIAENLEPGENVLLASTENTRFLFSADKNKDLSASKLATIHLSEDGAEIPFDLSDESDGTRRLMDLIPGILSVMFSDVVLVIDELDRSLHPDITHSFIYSFLNNPEKTNSQIIITSHDIGLMSNDLLRKDEVWFTQKNSAGESSLYSLDEFSDIRKDTDIRKGYKLGRYGGVPIVSHFSSSDLRD